MMKTQMILAALAAASLSAQGVAQQGDSLERALTDLNSGLTASADDHNMDIWGDARIRNAYAFGDGDNKDLDARYRLRFSFQLNENVSGTLGLTGFENWGSQVGDKLSGNDAAIDTRIDVANFAANNVFGDGGTITVGRDYYTLGSGRILGSDDWDNAPVVQTGIWYDHEANGMNLQVFALMSQDEDDFTGAGAQTEDQWGLTFDYAMDTPIGNVTLAPYILSDRRSGIGFEDGYYLGTAFGASMAGFDFDGELAKQDGAGNAYAIGTTIGLDALAQIPGVQDGALSINITSADDDFNPVSYADGRGAVQHGVGTLQDFLPNGIWSAATDATHAALAFSPGEGWNGSLGYWTITNGDADTNAWELSMGTTLAGAVDLWLGYTNASSDDADAGVGAASDDSTLWMTLGVAF
ncbi:MAG: alginate export family protein [Planctomycetes bacterium]|nr:alginate export family protein [Planctomycetota bacterium]